jgi:hypothetical protein
MKVLLAAGANPNVKAGDGSTPLHQAVTAQNVAMIRALAGAGASLDAVNKDNKTPLLLAEALPKTPPPPPNPGAVTGGAPKQAAKRDSRDDVIAALRELMKLGPNDPTPQPPPMAVAENAEGGNGKQLKGKGAPKGKQ